MVCFPVELAPVENFFIDINMFTTLNNTRDTLMAVDDASAIGKWNAELARVLLPDTICLGLYLLTGLIGNVTVLYIYIARIYSESRFFIPVLSVMDLAGVIINCSFSMSINLLPVRFDSDVACKVMWFLAMTSTGASAYTLLVIAVHRYLKICKPFAKQMTRRWKRLAIVIVIVVIVTISVPCFWFYGAAPVQKDGGQLTGYRCTSVTGNMPKFALVFKGVLFLTVVTELVTLIVLYTLIGRALFKQIKFSDQKKPVPATEASATSVTYESATAETDDEKRTGVHIKKNIDIGVSASYDSDQNTNAQKPPKQARMRKRRIPGFRISLMFMVITAVYIVCFLPKLIMMVWESRKPDFWQTMSDSEMGIFRFLYTLFILNNITNPFIYGGLDKKFQTELKKLCCWTRKN